MHIPSTWCTPRQRSHWLTGLRRSIWPPPPLNRRRLAKQGFTVTSVPTKPIEGQKTGTSGLRKKTKVFMSDNYLANW